MNETVAAQVLQKYGLDFRAIHSPQKGYRNTGYPVTLPDGRLINLIFYKRELNIVQRIRDANRISNFLATYDLPTRQTFGKIICLKTPTSETYGVPYTYLPGQTIPWEAYTMRHLKLLGMTMSHMHAVLQQAPAVHHSIADECSALYDRMRRYLYDNGVIKALHSKLGLEIHQSMFDHFNTVLLVGQKLPSQQVLHMDFVRGNVLFSGEADTLKISGILDFEKTAYGHRVFDIARTLAFLLVDCKFKSEAKVRKYFLRSGYNKHGKVQFSKPLIIFGRQRFDMLEELVDFFLLHDFYKFLRHNPYEFLEQNEHFVRTEFLLLRKGILRKRG